MMQRRESRFGLPALVCLIITSLLWFCPAGAYGAETLPPGMVIGDESGIYATSTGDYYVDLPSVLPGEVYEKEITIRSLDLEEPFSLGLLAEAVEQSGPIDFNDAITLTLTLDGTVIYQGKLLGDGSFDWTLQPLELGVCTYGTDKILQATFEVSNQLTAADYQEASRLLYNWTFVATKDVVEPPATSDSSSTSSESSSSDSGPTVTTTSSGTAKQPSASNLPSTGEDIKNMMYKVLLGFLMICLVLVLWKKRQEEE